MRSVDNVRSPIEDNIDKAQSNVTIIEYFHFERDECIVPGIELMDYSDHVHITSVQRDEIISGVHDLMEQFTGKRPGHTSFRYTPANHLDISFFDHDSIESDSEGFDYILVVDGEKTERTLELIDEIRRSIKATVADLLKIREEDIAVRYRLHDSSFG